MEHESFEDADDGGADERALRQRQGRPRGAARPRRGLHGRGRRADRARRLADDGLPRRPTGEPFFGGTYFPPAPRHGLPSFRQVLEAVAPAYRERRADVARSARAARRGGARVGELTPSTEPLTELAARRGRRGRSARSSTRSGAASAARRSSRRPRRSSSCLRRGELEPGRRRRSTRWPPAGCTTSSAAASTATRSTSAGSSRTSRRCSTTTRCSCPRTCTPGS